ncbi:hypothetical protein SAMN05216226_11124 [Halovenus aranensis]|jgi:hypothetical protein|uniref:Phospholipase_D-nuclease N-terminal n=1 Tax=Halovenus aranensis TaxID=890420 RepID=A0A1G8XEN0_9EURY|nr:hypothetical protein [Halovenus aranensis]SDJ88774.1 hypothetical protein SAMN05216226_11124 [Halovenus aranensis]
MEWLLVSILVGFPVLALLGAGWYVYRDAPKHGMSPRKWAALAALVPFFGFFAYIFERDDRTTDARDREEMFVDGPFQIHKSRADDTPLARSPEEDIDDEWDDDS